MSSIASEEREKKAHMMGEGEIKKVLLTLAVPAIVAMLINAVYNLADTAFVGMLRDTAAIGAVSVSFPLFMIIGAIGQAFGVGSASYISRCLGEKNNEEASRTASTAFFTAIGTGVLCTIICLTFLKQILSITGASETILPYAMDYSVILVLGSTITIVNMTLNNIIRAEGNSKFSMYALMIGAVLNIVLDPIFILTFDMKVKGAAIATIIGQGVSTIYLLSYFKRKKGVLSIDKKFFTPSKKIYSEIFKMGIPTFLMQFLASFGMALLNSAAVVYGDAAVASLGITIKINTLVTYVLFGYIQGFQPFVGYNYGAKKYDRVKKATKISLIWVTAYGVAAVMLLNIFSGALVRIFSNDVEVIKLGVNNIRGFSLVLPFLGFQILFNGLFLGLGRSAEAMVISVTRQGLFLIPAILVLPKLFSNNINLVNMFKFIFPNTMDPGLYGLMLTQPIADLLAIIVATILAINFLKTFNKKNENQQNLDTEVS
ncbi:MATE family efflux transporter [Clostridium sp. MSJ-11]|uniref:Multidrug export protein MepA n=1 Tax=Clostridium mobile TaxID=2841512 RepID=A0ABS6ELS2_9CLOT|nr:MATE family efflux transporter [Clostridium mobile]MBU5486171.1 MATE family efflux transporter [Clostridium mobile]